MNSSGTTMLPQASFVDIPAAHDVKQLLAFDDQSFVYCAYRSLLKRDPDDAGMAYYISRLRGGENKLQLLNELGKSTEGRRASAAIHGLDTAIRRFRLARLFGIGRAPSVTRQLQSYAAEKPVDVAAAPDAATPAAAAVVRIIRVPADSAPQNPEIKYDANGTPTRTVWVDLTTSMEWTEGVVGIIRAELEIASGLHRLHEHVRFSMQIENGFVEIEKNQLQWLLDSENVADAYMKFFRRYKKAGLEANASVALKTDEITVKVPDSVNLYFPFRANDIVISVGWMDSKKEVFFSKVKQKCSGVSIGYLVYDIVLLLSQTRHFYHILGQEKFKNYVKWISYNADFIIYGGNTAKNDTEALQVAERWPTPPGLAVKFGTDIMKSVDPEKENAILQKLGVTGPYIITVGSIEPRKNHDTLYKAYLLALETHPTGLPQLIICGRPMWRVDDIVDTIDRDPRLVGKIIRLSPTDTQLAALYKHCSFTLLPSLYEGWSLTLPESLGQGKFCLCADTPPLKEIGGDLVDYAPPWDVKTWADKIATYSFQRDKLIGYEKRIAAEWPQTRWRDTAQMIFDGALKFADVKFNQRSKSTTWDSAAVSVRPTIWLDITLSFLEWKGNVNGIIRSELNYARHLKQIAPNTRFFAYVDDYFFEVEESYLLWLFEDSDLSSAHHMFQTYWKSHEDAGTGYRNPFRITGGPVIGHPAYLNEFPENTIVLFVGIDFIEGRSRSRIIDIVDLADDRRGVMTSQLIYDFTPILYPQFHVKQTCSGYVPFVKHVSEKFGHLLYGGRTAQRDGIAIQSKNSWPSPPSNFVEFGSNLGNVHQSHSIEADAEMLSQLGVEGAFIMTVGTIEPRKNHELLYKAYVTLMETMHDEQLPKMLFIGKKGWKSDDFLASFEADNRIKGRVLILSPTDEQLDVLYRHCLFTLLPSFYEGWSLTLPESLSYGKFCLTSDVDPLRETGRDLVEYINPLDTYAWADRIRYYATHPTELEVKEAYIKLHWKPKTWKESTVMLRDALYAAHKARYTKEPQVAQIAPDAAIRTDGRKAVATVK